MMKRILRVILGLVAAAFLCNTTPANAGFVSAVTFTGGTISPTGALVSAGFSFKTNQSVTIDALADFSPLSTGSNVRLYNGQGTVLASATIFSSDPTDGTFYFHAITPITLSASSTYYIAADVVTGQLAEYSVTGLTTNPGISFGAAVETDGLGNNPTSDLQGGAFNPGYFGPSFEIRASAVPEPSGFALLGIGIIALLKYGRSRRKEFSAKPSNVEVAI
jgi:PEP-CTERM motif